MSGHERVVCPECKTVLRSCRCPDHHNERFELCENCRPRVRIVVPEQTEQRKALGELLRSPAPPAGSAALRTGALLALVSVLAGCPGPKSPVDYEDAAPTPEEAAQAKQGKTPCQQAAAHLEKLKCPEAAEGDFAVLCQKRVDNKWPICPTKLARIKTCAETATVCR